VERKTHDRFHVHAHLAFVVLANILQADNEIDSKPSEDGSGTGSVDAGRELGTGSVGADAHELIVQVIKK
jgi:hypothetical protein